MKSHKTSWTNEQKIAAVREWLDGGDLNVIAKRMGVTPSGVGYWKRVLLDGKHAHAAKSNGKQVVVAKVRGKEVAAIPSNVHAIRDATIFLRKGKAELMAGIRAGTISDLDSTHLLALLALNSLQGG